MSEKRIFRDRNRISGVRDARLIIIATEDAKATPKYFEDLKQFSRNSRVKVHVLERLDEASSPKYVLKSLIEFSQKHKLGKDDKLWAVIDVDHWKSEEISQIAEKCSQKRYRLAVSNPCFEIWLLLHLKSMGEYSEGVHKEFLESKKYDWS